MLAGLKLTFQYSEELIFEVTFTDQTISYVSIGEQHKGSIGSGEYKVHDIETNIHFIQWSDKGTGDFLSMVIDLRHMKIYSSVRTPNQGDLFKKGTISTMIALLSK